jgi:hypothetical protein
MEDMQLKQTPNLVFRETKRSLLVMMNQIRRWGSRSRVMQSPPEREPT